MEGGRIVEAIAQIAHHVTGPAQSKDQPLLLARLDLREHIHLLGPHRQGGVGQLLQLGAGEHLGVAQACFPTHPSRHRGVVASDHLQPDTETLEFGNGGGHARSERIRERQQTRNGHAGFVRAAHRTGHQVPLGIPPPHRHGQHPISLCAPGGTAIAQGRLHGRQRHSSRTAVPPRAGGVRLLGPWLRSRRSASIVERPSCPVSSSRSSPVAGWLQKALESPGVARGSVGLGELSVG